MKLFSLSKQLYGLVLFAAVAIPTNVFAQPAVSANTISWPDDGWYQVQDSMTFESLCEGGLACEVSDGTYIVINHTTGQRFENIVVGGTGPTVTGNTISLPDNGWYQVQVQGDFTSSLCGGERSCEVEAGTYVVINHTTGVRYENSVVTGEGSLAPMSNIVETAMAAEGFETLVTALQATALDSVLADEDATFTVFAPTDAAFEALGSDTINALLADTETLSDILLYHVVSGAAVDAATAVSLAGGEVEMANGDVVSLSLREESLFVNDSQVIVTDILASNGIIHVIDAVLLPPSDEGPVTDTPSVDGNILEVAAAAGDFSLLLAAIDAAGLADALSSENDNYTVFAPTDAAFEALGSETLNALLADPETLGNILLFHVLSGPMFTAEDFSNILGFDVIAANGGTLNVTATETGLAVNGVNIVAADISTSNGIIHVIDAVLVPPSE